jgi:hypothetical protein
MLDLIFLDTVDTQTWRTSCCDQSEIWMQSTDLLIFVDYSTEELHVLALGGTFYYTMYLIP